MSKQSIEFRIIIIDDNPAIHQDFIKVLATSINKTKLLELDKELFGNTSTNNIQQNPIPLFEIETAEQGQEGVEKIKLAIKEGKPFALAFVDIRMPPGWDGLETIKHIWEIDPNVQVVICTAYSDYSWEDTVQQLGLSDNLLILKKPFDTVAVRQLASALTRKWLLTKEANLHTESLRQIVAERTQSLNQSVSLLRATIDSSTDGILVTDLTGKIVDYNQQFVHMWNLSRPLLQARNFALILQSILEQLLYPEDFANQVNCLAENISESNLQIIEGKNNKAFEYYSQPHCIDTSIVGRIYSFRDITEKASLEKKLQFQATHDPLTGLPNRTLIHEKLINTIRFCAQQESHCAVLFIDLDRFKLVNDSWGHHLGDKLLKAVAKRIAPLIRSQDTLARLGGDEFVIILTGLEQGKGAANVAQKIITALNKPLSVGNQEIIMPPSIGISIYPYHGKTANTLLKNADVAMYQAKQKGGNQFKFYTRRANPYLSKQLQKEAELRTAIKNHEFFMLYQPQFNVQNQDLLAVEALVRWQHPKKGLLSPNEFIPLAEESGLIIPLGDLIINEVCQQMSIWQSQGLPRIRVAINIGSQQLRQRNFAKRLEAILQKYKIEPQYLELEIIENVIIVNPEVQSTLQELKNLGVKIVLDDFGTGNSSLNYLKRIQFDRLKIDQSFIKNISKSRSDEVIIQAIIAMAQSLNFKVVAEGVENQRQINFLKERYCDEVQGFLLSEPLTAQAVEVLLKKHV
ncbi:sensory box protein, GGDEF family protein, LssE [Legionella busanensis]|uniref:cyclic-guanylate-specific phosphodiesterase n=1 Tax=Legionella busanensis TaxID=190655 RepID=A0A378JJ96_9GAMM|nr:EAL domain-containing protein [Legionella busanensis]STX50289.1 sensory box protein, GGDEF family protein, LssE [Legionella busanensis]